MEQFTWIPIYKELAVALLKFKDNRKPLVDWIYANLNDIKTGDKSLISYLHEEDGSNITDIDPFSVFGIFNRGISVVNQLEILGRFKNWLGLKSDLPKDFIGIPILNAMRSFFYTWKENETNQINRLWTFYQKVFNDEDFSEEFDKIISGRGVKSMLTMGLFWILPDKYIAWDTNNKGFFKKYNVVFDDDLNYANYMATLTSLKELIANKKIPFQSFYEFSYEARMDAVNSATKIWMIWGDEKSFASTRVSMGSTVSKDIPDFSIFDNKIDLRAACQKSQKNTDVSISYAYWQFIDEVKPGDIIVLYRNGNPHHIVYGWGRITSGIIYENGTENPLQREVEWNLPAPESPIEFEAGTNKLFFHQLKKQQVKEIRKILDIPSELPELIETEAMSKYDTYIELLKENHNLVLTGAPGTGKTYLAKKIAKEMGCTEEKGNFVQFHPSYDYTDFVEGLRPVENSGFERKDGVFKEFCKKAILGSIKEDEFKLQGLNNDPKIWKVSLEGTGDNPTRTDCLENGYIRIGWYRYGDVDDFNDFDDFYEGGKSILKAFQNEMRVGDIVVSCYGEYVTDAIGVITGDYEYRREGVAYPRYRNVEWIVKDVKLNTNELIGKRMTLSTIYKLNIPVSKLVDFIKESGALKSEVNKVDVPYVFIIDEINRGELSKIFGELFYAIDPGYRGEKGKVQTQYQNLVPEEDLFSDGFFVPENVYILATMNDIDRSVESMDFAMRRRFAWEEIRPEDRIEMLDSLGAFKNEAVKRMNSLNAVIADTEGLGEAFQVGPAYFLKLKNGDFSKLWKMNLAPLLKEYLRGFRKAKDILISFEKAYNLQ